MKMKRCLSSSINVNKSPAIMGTIFIIQRTYVYAAYKQQQHTIENKTNKSSNQCRGEIVSASTDRVLITVICPINKSTNKSAQEEQCIKILSYYPEHCINWDVLNVAYGVTISFCLHKSFILTHFSPMSHFYTP